LKFLNRPVAHNKLTTDCNDWPALPPPRTLLPYRCKNAYY